MALGRRESSPIGQLMRLHMHAELCMTALQGRWLLVATVGGERIEGEGDTPTLAIQRCHKGMCDYFARDGAGTTGT